jgi:hypothetical protein
MRNVRLSLLLSLVIAACSLGAAQPPLQVGVYRGGLGGGGITKALAGRADLKVAPVSRLTLDGLAKVDVLCIGSCGLDRPEDLRALRIFVGMGGGLVLNHGACGRGRPATPFPDVAARVTDRREDTTLRVAEASSPLAAGLPAEFEHAYYDHLLLEPGPKSTVVLRDHAGDAVVVAGEVGAGRVVFNGALPGYAYDAATFAQGEAPPTGAELQLVINALQWAGAGRMTTRPQETLAEARGRLEQEQELADLRRLLPTPAWFGPEMLTGSYAPMPPVNELGGRFFITYDSFNWRGYERRRTSTPQELEFFRNRMRLDVMQLKWLGVTDIVYWVDAAGDRVYHSSTVPDAAVQFAGVDPLGMLVELAEAADLKVWVAWHSCSSSEPFAQKYCGKDAQGKLYTYGAKDYCEDLLSPAWRERCHRLIDEYAARYGKSKSFQGIAAYDELWFVYADYHEDDLPAIDRFCQEFGEKLPADFATRLAQRGKWLDPDDVWRRRYILFKQQVITDYCRDLIDYCHSKRLQFGLEILATARYGTGWSWGMDSPTLARLGADFLVTSPSDGAEAYYPNTVRWAHSHDGWGVYNTHCFRGGPGGIYFTFNQLWRPIMYGNNPHVTAQVARHIVNQRQWANGQSLARVAVLHNQNAMQMLLANTKEAANAERAVWRALSAAQPTEAIFTAAPEEYSRYRVLVAPPYSTRGLAPEVMQKLRAFVEGGGTVVSLGARCSQSRPDLTQEQDLTAEIIGATCTEARPEAPVAVVAGQTRLSLSPGTSRQAATPLAGTQVLAQFEPGGTPAVTERRLGQGRVIALHFDAGAELEKTPDAPLAQWLSQLIQGAAAPEVRAEGQGCRVMSALRKGNWIGVALFPTAGATMVKLAVDPAALGLSKQGFRLLMLGKQMEIQKPGDVWGERGFWTPEELKAGFTVTICEDNESNRPLPEQFDLDAFTEWGRGYVEAVTRKNFTSLTEGVRKRDYAHEIVVLAPADEPTMPQ